MAAYGFDREKTYPASMLPDEIKQAIKESHEESEKPYDLPRWQLLFVDLDKMSKEAWDFFWDNEVWKLMFTEFRYIKQEFYVTSRPNDGKAPGEFCRVRQLKIGGYLVDWCEYDGITDDTGDAEVELRDATPEQVIAFGLDNFPEDDEY